jgi:hypothetical protein
VIAARIRPGDRRGQVAVRLWLTGRPSSVHTGCAACAAPVAHRTPRRQLADIEGIVELSVSPHWQQIGGPDSTLVPFLTYYSHH